MYIGLTYDLRDDYLNHGYSMEETAEFDRMETIQALEDTLIELNHKTVKIGHIKYLIDFLSKGNRCDLVFNIAEGLSGNGREAAIPAILDAYCIPYTFSDPLLLAISLHKPTMNRIIRDHGFPVSDFWEIKDLDDLKNIKPQFPLFAKPSTEGTGKGIDETSIINNTESLVKTCKRLLSQFRQSVLLETYLEGREFTVGLLGTGNNSVAVGTIEIKLNKEAQQGAYSYLNKEKCESLVEYVLCSDDCSKKAEDLALAIWKSIGFRDAGRIDLRCNKDQKPFFLEANPISGLHPSHSDLPIICSKKGICYRELINSIVNSAQSRIV